MVARAVAKAVARVVARVVASAVASAVARVVGWLRRWLLGWVRTASAVIELDREDDFGLAAALPDGASVHRLEVGSLHA